MQWFSLFLRLFMARKAFQQTESLQETAAALAEKGKRYILAAMLLAFAGLFFFSALMVAVINLGLQLEHDGALSYSGLMISASVFAGIACALALIGALLWNRKKAEAPVEVKSSPAEGKVKELLEEFLVSFLSQLAGSKHNAGQAKEPKPPSGTTEGQ